MAEKRYIADFEMDIMAESEDDAEKKGNEIALWDVKGLRFMGAHIDTTQPTKEEKGEQ